MAQVTQITIERMAHYNKLIIAQLVDSLKERMDDMRTSWVENVEEAMQNDDNFPPLKLSISVTVDIDKSEVKTDLKFVKTYKTTKTSVIKDENQPELPI